MPNSVTDPPEVARRTAAQRRSHRVRNHLARANLALTCLESAIGGGLTDAGRDMLSIAQEAVREAADELVAR